MFIKTVYILRVVVSMNKCTIYIADVQHGLVLIQIQLFIYYWNVLLESILLSIIVLKARGVREPFPSTNVVTMFLSLSLPRGHRFERSRSKKAGRLIEKKSV